MKYRIYDYSNSQKLENLKDASISEIFEVTPGNDLTLDEAVKQGYEIIELEGNPYAEFSQYLGVIDWKTNQIGMTDCLVLEKDSYKPLNILADSVMRVLKNNKEKIDSQRPVIVIGDSYFVFTMTMKLALSGFSEILVSIVDMNEKSDLDAFENKIKKIVFDLNIKVIPINDLTSTDRAGYLLISNFKKEKNKDAYELLTYFNFLAEGAIFIDCNSINDSYLVEDARGAEIFVIDELEILKTKYEYLLETLKNSPKV